MQNHNTQKQEHGTHNHFNGWDSPDKKDFRVLEYCREIDNTEFYDYLFSLLPECVNRKIPYTFQSWSNKYNLILIINSIENFKGQ